MAPSAPAGKLQIATGRSVAVAVAVSVPEARVMALPQGRDGELAVGCARRIAREIRACDSLLIGPGMVSAAAAGSIVRHALSTDGDATLVADAAALPAFRGVRVGRRAAVLTPNAGEMAQMTGLTRARVERDAPRVAAEMAAASGAVSVLKGNPTVVAAPSGALYARRAGNAGLGTSGSGDTLSGVIAGFAARGAAPWWQRSGVSRCTRAPAMRSRAPCGRWASWRVSCCTRYRRRGPPVAAAALNARSGRSDGDIVVLRRRPAREEGRCRCSRA